MLDVWRGLEQSVISDAINEWREFLCERIHAKGGYFKHLCRAKSTYVRKLKVNQYYCVKYIKSFGIFDLLHFTI